MGNDFVKKMVDDMVDKLIDVKKETENGEVNDVAVDTEVNENAAIFDELECFNSEAEGIRIIELSVVSPVNVMVSIKDEDMLLMHMDLDLNTGIDYAFTKFSVSEPCVLHFESRGFHKTLAFDPAVLTDPVINYDLNNLLTDSEIVSSYDRTAALEQLKICPTSYAFKQLSRVGTAKDIPVLMEELKKLDAFINKNKSICTLMVDCVSALCELAVRFNKVNSIRDILPICKRLEMDDAYSDVAKKTIKVLEKKNGGPKFKLPDLPSGAWIGYAVGVIGVAALTGGIAIAVKNGLKNK